MAPSPPHCPIGCTLAKQLLLVTTASGSSCGGPGAGGVAEGGGEVAEDGGDGAVYGSGETLKGGGEAVGSEEALTVGRGGAMGGGKAEKGSG